MIRISVHLISARDGSVTELGRMDIINDGTGSDDRMHYVGRTYRGRDKKALDKGTISKTGLVRNWPRHRFHIWNLVRRMLSDMGYNELQRDEDGTVDFV